MKTKPIIVIVALLAVGYILSTSGSVFVNQDNQSPRGGVNLSFPAVFLPTLQMPNINEGKLMTESWAVFESYLEFAKAHNLQGIRSLSYQLSETCSNPEKEAECFALMDNLSEIASTLKEDAFTHIMLDDRQIILSTDGPVVAILYFVRDNQGSPKILGLSYCLEKVEASEQCVETDPAKRDKDNNGWWDAIENLFN